MHETKLIKYQKQPSYSYTKPSAEHKMRRNIKKKKKFKHNGRDTNES